MKANAGAQIIFCDIDKKQISVTIDTRNKISFIFVLYTR